MEYLFHLLIIAGIYGLAALGLDFFAGRAGVLSACQAALMGVGAYASATALGRGGLPWAAGLAIGVAASASIAPLVGLVSLRARGDYFVLATLALQAIFANVANNWVSLTGGPFGLKGIPRPEILGLRFASTLSYLGLVMAMLAVVTLAIRWLERTAFFPALRGGRDDAVLLVSAGKNWHSLRLEAYVLGGALAGLAGSLLAHYVTFIDPATFSLEESVFILSIALVGGLDRVWGPVAGAAFLTLVPELLRLLIPGFGAGFYLRAGLSGLALLLVVLLRPRGLLGRFSLVRPRYD